MPVYSPRPGFCAWSPSVTKAEQHLEHLLQLLRPITVAGCERSFKIFDGSVLPNRYLIGVDKRTSSGDPDETILEFSRRLNMPPCLLETLTRRLPEVNFILFGFEENETTCVYKVYLEYYDTFGSKIKSKPSPTDPMLMHLGLKWDLSNSDRTAIAEYIWYPRLSGQTILTRIADIYPTPRYKASLDIVESIFRVAAGKMNRRDILYIEVAEGGNPRRSFDVNLYKANLTLRDLEPILLRLCEHYAIDSDLFEGIYHHCAANPFGHLAAGIDRQGRDFLTIYYETTFSNLSQAKIVSNNSSVTKKSI